MKRHFPTHFCRRWLVLLLLNASVLLFTGCYRSSRDTERLSRHIEELTGAHTRIVWVQDSHDRTDVFARGNQLRLMGYDSQDGRGERVILPGPDNYAKPLLLDDGETIVFSNYLDGHVYSVDWEGAEVTRLMEGRALDVWRDQSGVDWVFVGTERSDEGAPSYHRVTRHRIDNPSISEHVWEGQPVGEDSFQLSADGRVAAGNFPWPECGIMHIPEQRIELLGRGCWTSLAPDNSYRFWIFDGSHRNLLLFDTVSGERTTIPISQAPGINNHEVYHPRWSNDPRIMVMTGPYKIRHGGNNIRGGGEDVEIHIGRFNADFSGIESWVQVTSNAYANFFPDVWVDTNQAKQKDVHSQRIRELTGARTRITWLKDVGRGDDYLAQGNELQLMGLDTDDGRGIRMIVPAGRNMAKPMLTVDGHRVVVSDRETGTMHMVDWEGEQIRDLGEGFVLHTWEDPATGVEWLYYTREVVEDGKILPTHAGLYRQPLDDDAGMLARWLRRIRNRAELVWEQTHVSEDSYQLSADGRFASAAFPWPEIGVHDVQAQQWQRYGQGCWTALSPDNSYILWLLDGAHRNLIMQRVNAKTPDRWTVRINELPVSNQYEVYHPRWSNHSHILTVTGPYSVGEGSYRLPGGGNDVEVWVGRFSQDYREISEWVQVTENVHANFYPDVWVEPREGEVIRSGHSHDREDDIVLESWPSPKDDLLYLWEHGAAQNEVVHPVTGARQIYRPEARALARFGLHHSMWVDKGYFTESVVPEIDNTFSLEASLHNRQGEGILVAFDEGFSFGITNKQWVANIGADSFVLGDVLDAPFIHIVVSASPNVLTLYQNGSQLQSVELDAPLHLHGANAMYWGGHPEKGYGGLGRLSHLAWYDRVLTKEEIEHHAAYLADKSASRESPTVETVRGVVRVGSSIPTPEDIAPYTRALIFKEYEVIEGERAGEHLMAAHWGILGGNVLADAKRPVGSEHDLQLVLFDDRPELEGERVVMDNENFLLDWYYDLTL